MRRTSMTIHGGDIEALKAASGLPESGLIDASANLNPLGPPPWLDAAFAEARRLSGRYPDPRCRALKAAASSCLSVPPEALVFGNGADELMFACARAQSRRLSPLAEPATRRPTAIVEAPSYASYREASERAGFDVATIPARMPARIGAGAALSGDGFQGGAARRDSADAPLASERAASGGSEARYAEVLASTTPGSLLWMGAPNNPTGLLPDGYPALAVRLAERFPDRVILCDEAFIDFAEDADPAGAAEAAARLPNLIVIRSMTKFWAAPGLRIGYTVSNPALAQAIRAELSTWPLNAVAEAFARRAFLDPGLAERRASTRTLVASERRRVAELLAKLSAEASAEHATPVRAPRDGGIEVFESRTNYYLLRSPKADVYAESLARQGVAVRSCANFEDLGPEYLRVAVRTPGENDAIAAAFACAVGPRIDKRAATRRPHGAKALMIQGCSSNAGKSLIAAAFCRIFRDEGRDVAPYKAQNMSLNSAVTIDGLELGRAQAVQAAACGLEPDVRMNPVLLKPESDRGSQIVLMGKPFARREARDYYASHASMRDAAFKAYDSLAGEHELIVLEGAGSPAEINLRSRDFVNMEAALHAQARVLLVGDIDRGGVFASFIGHVSTFAPAELGLFSGFIVNKFRGDPALLGDAFAMTRERTGYPVLGCVPMIPALDIPDEDEPVVKAGSRPGAELRVAVPRLRRVSNFTDLDAFACEPDVEVVPVSTGTELERGGFDAVVIPGSKSTVADLAWVRESGLAEAIRRFASHGGAVVGICGGYQMLGARILDPDGVESSEARTEGLGLLPLVTAFASGKTLARTRARWIATGDRIEGYEIHHGSTRLEAGDAALNPGVVGTQGQTRPVIESEDGGVIGYGRGAVWGSYLHGVFDADDFRRGFLNELRARRGLGPLPSTRRPSLDAEIARLADVVKANVDMAAIRSELGL